MSTPVPQPADPQAAAPDSSPQTSSTTDPTAPSPPSVAAEPAPVSQNPGEKPLEATAGEEGQQTQAAAVAAAPAAAPDDASSNVAPAEQPASAPSTTVEATPAPDAAPAVTAGVADGASSSGPVNPSSPPAAQAPLLASESTAAPPPSILQPKPAPATGASLSTLAPASAAPSRDASPSSTTSSTRLAAAHAPGQPAPVKKFSALNVNKKFLETAIQSAGKENKDAAGAGGAAAAGAAKSSLATGPPAKAPTPVPHPPSRLLTTRPTPPPAAAPRPAAPPSQWGAKAALPSAPGLARGGKDGSAPWGAAGGPAKDAGGLDGPSWRSRQEFPTTKESAEDRAAAAQRAAQNQAQAAKAEEEHQKAIIEELDSFRGSHLDPNAHHWDEPESDDDDFLDEVVDFGDGKKYTISASPQEPSFAAEVLQSRERLVAAENAKLHPPKGDFDRGHAASKPVLFNDRSNRFEAKDGPSAVLQRGRRPSNDASHAGRAPPPHVAASATHNPNATPLPPSRPAWGIQRDANGKIIPSLPPSRALPPHLAAAGASALPTSTAAPLPPASAPAARASTIPPRTSGLATARTTTPLAEKRPSLAAPRGALAKPAVPTPATAAAVTPAASIPTGPAADRRLSHDGPRPAAPVAPAAAAAPVAEAPKKLGDITELQKDEMHTAAERARLRRQKEEEERLAAQERARQKAKELEAKFGPAPSKAEAKAPAKSSESSWKRPLASTKPSPPTAAPTAAASSAPAAPARQPVLPPPAPQQTSSVIARQALPHQSTQSTAPRRPSQPAAPVLAAAPPDLKQLLAGQDESQAQDIDFANLQDLLEPASSELAAAQTSAVSRRPAAADFFDRPPTSTGPVLPPPAASRSETTSSWRRSPKVETVQVKLPAPQAFDLDAPAATSPSAEVRSPKVRVGSLPPGGSSMEDVLQRIKGAMAPPSASQLSSIRAPVPVQVLPAEPLFTYLPRPVSPSPVWKKFAVNLNKDTRRLPPMTQSQLRIDPKRETLRAIDPLSWNPSMYKWLRPSTLSRDDWLLAPPFRKVLGRIAPPPAPVVSLPTKLISDLPVNPPPESPVYVKATVVKLPAASTPSLEVIPPTPGRLPKSAQEATWRRAPQGPVVVDPSAAVGGPLKSSTAAPPSVPGQPGFNASQASLPADVPVARLRTPPGRTSPAPKLPHGSVVGFYRDRTPSIGASSDEQMASMVRFTVSSELLDATGEGDGAFDEEVPAFPSLMRPASTVGSTGVAPQDETNDSAARSATTSATSALSPPSAATSDAWSKTPMAYTPADRPVLPGGLYGAQPGVPSHSMWAAGPSSLDAAASRFSPKLSTQYTVAQQQQQQQQQHQHPMQGQLHQHNPYQQQQLPRYQQPAMGFALPTSSPHPQAAGTGAAIYSTMNGAAPRFQPSGQQQQQQQHQHQSSSRPDPSARPFVPHGAHPAGQERTHSADFYATGGGAAGPAPIGGSPYSPGVSLPGLPPAIQGGVWVPISMPMASARSDSAYQSSPSLSASPLPTPYYTPQQPVYGQHHHHQQQQQQQRPATGAAAGNPSRFRNLSEFSTSSPVFTPLLHQQQQQQQQQQAQGAFDPRAQPGDVALGKDLHPAHPPQQQPQQQHGGPLPSARAPVFTPGGAGAGAGAFSKAGPW